MTHHRILLSVITSAIVLALHAQPYPVYITGLIEGCQNGSSLYLETGPGVTPVTNEEVGPLTENNGSCHFFAIWSLDDTEGTIYLSTPCSNGDSAYTSATYDVNLDMDSAVLVINVNCNVVSVQNLGQEAPGFTILTSEEGLHILRLRGFPPGLYRGGVWDASGRLVKGFHVQAQPSSMDISLGSGQLAPGVYTVGVGSGLQGSRGRFVVE